MRDGEKVANVKMTEKIEEREGIIIDSSTNGVFNGVGYMYDSYLSGDHIIALEAPERYQFAYWINENNDIVSYNEKYHEYASTRVYTQHLYAVYTKEAIEEKPAISISLTVRFPYEYEEQAIETIAIRARYSSNEYKIKEIGIIRTYDSLYKNKLTLDNVDGNNIRKNTSSNSSGYLRFIYSYNLSMSETTKLKPIYARAYAIYTDSTGKDQTIYSNVAYSAPLN